MPTLYEIVREHAERDPARMALLSELDGTRSYAELFENASALAHAFANELALPAGARVCSWLWNRPESVETNLACTAAGISNVPSNPQWSERELGFVLEHARCRVLICGEEDASRALEVQRRVGGVEQVIVTSGAAPGAGVAYRDLLATAPPNAAAAFPRPAPPDTPSALMYTSGTTTGRPKAVHFQRDFNARIVDYEQMFGITPEDRGIFVTPLFHGNGSGALHSALIYGASAVFARRFSARRFWPLVARTQPTYFYTLAPIAQILMGLPATPEERGHRLRVMIALGAGPALAAMEERFRVPIIDWYGMTEAGSGTYTRLSEERKPGSAGRAFDAESMRILREDGSQADPGETGEVCFDTSRIPFRGYVDDEEATAAVLKDGWFHTGDLGYFDEDGYFFFVDRKKDLIRRGGENISGLEVESVLMQHPDVAEVAVLGRPDPVLGERVVAFVVPREGARLPTLESLRALGEKSLAPFKLPEELHASECLPRTTTGKVQKFALRELLASRPEA